jgi:hypothetical protein
MMNSHPSCAARRRRARALVAALLVLAAATVASCSNFYLDLNEIANPDAATANDVASATDAPRHPEASDALAQIDAEDAADVGTMDADASKVEAAPSSDAGHSGDASKDAESRDAGSKDVGLRDSETRDAPAPTRDAAPPSLTALSVTAGATPTLTLVPAFSPAIHDYSVRCTTGVNALTVSMTASSGSTSLVVLPTPSASLATQTLTLNVEENQAIVATATDGTSSTEYWVRCLPANFPALEINVHLDGGAATPGYYLVGNAAIGNAAGYAMILDSQGVPVWYYGAPLAGYGMADVDSLAPGEVSFMPTNSYTGTFEIDALSSPPISYVNAVDLDQNELRVLPNGHYLVFEIPVVQANLTGLTLPLPDGGAQSFGTNSYILECEIQEINPVNGAAVWTWNATDHFDPVQDLTFRNHVVVLEPSGIVEPFHCDSIAVDTNGNLLVSARYMDSVFYIEKSTGKVLWKMGGSTYSKDNATYIPVADPFFRPYDARFQPGWSSACGGGPISLFDDETDRAGPARAVVYDVSVPLPGDAGAGAACGDAGAGGAPGATVAWEYKGTASVGGLGSFRILPDGSRIISWGYGGSLFAFSEVDVAGNDLVDFELNFGNFTDRAIKVPLSQFDLNALRTAAGAP